MKKLTKNQTKKVTGGAQASGAFLSGIGSIINAIGNTFSTIVGTVVNAVHSFTDKDHYKATYKYGNATMSYDDTKRAEVEKEQIKAQIKTNQQIDQIIKIKPVEVQQFSSLKSENLELTQTLQNHQLQNFSDLEEKNFENKVDFIENFENQDLVIFDLI